MNQLSQADARAFIVALNTIAQFVPPMHMQPLLGNPICRQIEAAANNPDTTTPEQAIPERFKPQAVT